MSKQETKIIEGVRPHLAAGEEPLVATRPPAPMHWPRSRGDRANDGVRPW